MIFPKRYLPKIWLAVILATATFGAPAPVPSHSGLKPDAIKVSWTHLSFYAQNFWVKVSTDIELTSLPSADLNAILIEASRGKPIEPATPETALMAIHTTIDPRFRSPVKILNRIWFDPTDASAIGRIRLRRGEDDFKKIYRFTEQGVFRHRREPKNRKEASLAPEKWSDVKDSFYPYDPDRLTCSAVTERSLLIYILSSATASSKNIKPASLCVFGKRQLHRVELQQAGRSSIEVDYIEKSKQGELRRQKTINALKITLSSEPMESDLKTAENFSFLGFHKDIVIHIDPASGIPLQVSGNIPGAGKAGLNLSGLRLKK